MKPLSVSFLPILAVLIFSTQTLRADEVLDFLKTEIQRTARQRDEARKQLLKEQSDAELRVNALGEAQQQLNKQLESNARELMALEAAARMSQSSVERAEEEIAARDARIHSLEEQQTQNRSHLRGLEQQLRDMQATEAGQLELRQDFQELQQTLEERNTELESLNAQREQSAAEQSELAQLNSQLQQELRDVRRAESLATAKQAALESRLDHLQSELARQYEMRSELEQEQERLQTIIAELQARLSEAESTRVPQAELEQVQSILREALAENEKLREDLERREQIPDLREDFERVQRERDLLQATQKTLTTRLDDMQHSLEKESADKVALRENNQNLSAQLQDEKNRGRALEEQITLLEGQSARLEEVGAQRDHYRQVNLRSQQNMRVLASHIRELREQVVQSQEARRQLELDLQRRQVQGRELYETKRDVEVLKHLNSALMREDGNKETRIRQLREEVEIGRDRSRTLQAEKEALRRQLQHIQSQLEPLPPVE